MTLVAGPIPRSLTKDSLTQGVQQLTAADADLGAVVLHLGEPPMWGRRPGFAALIQIILEQQISLAAARAMYLKLAGFLGQIRPETIYALQVRGLREFGLTRQKSGYCHGLAERIVQGRLDLTAVARQPDDIGCKQLLAIPGLGPWSVGIYYLMALRRPDIWPQGDLALANALRDIKHLTVLPSSKEQHHLACSWAPWRSVAARILWMHYLAKRGQYPD